MKSLTDKGEFGPHALPISAWAKGDTECLLALAGRYKPLTGFCHKLYEVAAEPQIRAPHLLGAGCFIHAFTQTHRRVSKVQQKTCSLGE